MFPRVHNNIICLFIVTICKRILYYIPGQIIDLFFIYDCTNRRFFFFIFNSERCILILLYFTSANDEFSTRFSLQFSSVFYLFRKRFASSWCNGESHYFYQFRCSFPNIIGKDGNCFRFRYYR